MKSSDVVNWGRWRIAWVSAGNLDAIANLLIAKEIDGVGLSPYHGFDGDTTALGRLPPFAGLVVLDTDLVICDQIPNLREMKFLSLGGTRSRGISFNGFRNLEDLRLSWHSNDVLPNGQTPLKSLYLRGYAAETRDLSNLPAYRELTSLELVQPNVVNLEGVQRLVGLRDVNLSYCRKLKSVAALVGTTLERVHLESCAHVADIPVLVRCPHLKSIRLSSCGTLDSLKFLADSKTIEEFRFVKTNVRDGDMTPLFKMKSVGFLDKRGYSHTCEQVNEAIRHGIRAP